MVAAASPLSKGALRARTSKGARGRLRVAAAQGGEGPVASREPWDFGRFARTLLTFQPPPELIAAPLRAVLGATKAETPAEPITAASDMCACAFPALDDVVMGGVSTSSFELEQGAGEGGGLCKVFRGTVSESNSGGFASVRSAPLWDPPVDLRLKEGLAMRVRGDGLRYKVTLRTEQGWDTSCWSANLDTTEGEWQTVQIPFSAFEANFRAKRLPGEGAPKASDLSHVYNLQVMLTKFGLDSELNPKFKPGPFALPIASITAYP